MGWTSVCFPSNTVQQQLLVKQMLVWRHAAQLFQEFWKPVVEISNFDKHTNTEWMNEWMISSYSSNSQAQHIHKIDSSSQTCAPSKNLELVY